MHRRLEAASRQACTTRATCGVAVLPVREVVRHDENLGTARLHWETRNAYFRNGYCADATECVLGIWVMFTIILT